MAALAVAGVLATSEPAAARPGTHPIVVSTWDTRASSVVLQYRRGFLDGGGFHVVSYNANFSATSGKLSSQFGLHYLNFSEAQQPSAHGLSATAAAVFNFPLAQRFDNGLPLVAFGLMIGSAPTALVSGERNFVSVPFVLGVGVPVTPAKLVTITPWFELSPSLNLDTVIKPYKFTAADLSKYVNLTTREINFTAEDVQDVVNKSVELEASVIMGARGGLDVALHASDSFDLVANATLSSVGKAFSGVRVWYLGGGVAWRWDDIVPAVLPPEKRLSRESCEAIEQRFRSCPNSQRWRAPEEQPSEPLNTPPALNSSPNSSSAPGSSGPVPSTVPAAPGTVPTSSTATSSDSGATPPAGTNSPLPSTPAPTPDQAPRPANSTEPPPMQSVPISPNGANP